MASPAMSESLPCLNCGKAAANLCSRCRAVAFCNRVCQRSSWQSHKLHCTPFGSTLVLKKGHASSSSADPGVPIIVNDAMSFARIVSLLRDNLGDAAFVSRGMDVLYWKIPDEAAARSALEAGAMAPVAAALRVYATSARVWKAAGQVLQNLTIVDAGIEAALGAALVPSLVTALSTHEAKMDVCSVVAAVLNHISDFPAGKDALLAARAIVPLVRNLRTYAFDAKACLATCGALVGLSGSAVALDEASALGAISLTISALREHSSSATICTSACAFLAAVSARPRGGGAVLAAGALHPLISALRIHLKNVGVCYHANQTIWNVAISGGGEVEVLAAGAAPLFVASFSTHVADVINFAQGAALIRVLTNQSLESGEAVASAGAAGPLIKALQLYAHERSERMVLLALQGLRSICVWRDCCATVDAVSAVTVALRAHSASAAVCENAGSILCRIFSVPAGADAALAAGPGEIARLLVSALRCHQNDGSATLQVTSVLQSLAVFPTGRDAICMSGAPEALVDTLRAYKSSNSDICASSCRAICNVVCSNRDVLIRVAPEVTPLLIGTLSNHVDKVDVCNAAASVLAQLLNHDDLKSGVIAAGAAPPLYAVAARHELKDCQWVQASLMLLEGYPKDWTGGYAGRPGGAPK